MDIGLSANTRVLGDHEISDVLGDHTGCIELEPECGDARTLEEGRRGPLTVITNATAVASISALALVHLVL